MKKLFRFLILLLFINVTSTMIYAMTDQKSAQTEQKIPEITAKHPFTLIFELETLLKKGINKETLLTAIKQQKIDVNAQGQKDDDVGFNAFRGWTALQIGAHGIAISSAKTPEEIVHLEEAMQILLAAGADFKAKVVDDRVDDFNDLTALELIARLFKRIEKIKTARLLIALGADTSKVVKLRDRKISVKQTPKQIQRRIKGMKEAIRLGEEDKKRMDKVKKMNNLTSLMQLMTLS